MKHLIMTLAAAFAASAYAADAHKPAAHAPKAPAHPEASKPTATAPATTHGDSNICSGQKDQKKCMEEQAKKKAM